MTEFDPYHIWLGIPETERPISKYRLLGIADFENNREVISAAAEQRTIYLRTLQAGEHEVLVAELLNEVSQARVTLLNADQKAEYDEELRKQQAPEPVPEPAPIPVVQTPDPTPVVVRGTVTQEFPVSVVQSAKRPRRRQPKQIWKQPAVIGIAVVSVIGVFVLFISMMSSGLFISRMSPGDADPVARTDPPVVTSLPIPTPQVEAEQKSQRKMPSGRPRLLQVAQDIGGLIQSFSFDNETLEHQDGSIGVGGHIVQDTSGVGVNGTCFGPGMGISGATGVSGQCFQFKGESGVEFSDSVLPKGSESRTVMYWMKAPPQRNHGVQFSYGIPAPFTAFTLVVCSDVNIDSSFVGKLTLSQFGDPRKELNISSIKGIVDDQWHHVAITHNERITELYIDGEEVAENPLRKDTQSTNDGRAIIGNFHIGNHGYVGAIDEFMVFDHSLVAGDIKRLYQAALKFTPGSTEIETYEPKGEMQQDPERSANTLSASLQEGLIAYYPFNEAYLLEFPVTFVSSYRYTTDDTEGHSLAAQGKVATHGFMLHPKSNGEAAVRYDLPVGVFTYLKGAVTVEDGVTAKSPLVFEIFDVVDREEILLWRSEKIENSDSIEGFCIKLPQSGNILLRANSLGSYDSAHALWIDPMLFKDLKGRTMDETKLDLVMGWKHQ